MATFGVTAVGEFLAMQVIYVWKTKQSLPKFKFSKSFQCRSRKTAGPIPQNICQEYFCEVVIVLHNLANKFRLDHLFLTCTIGSQKRYLPSMLMKPSPLWKSRYLLRSQTSNHCMVNGLWISTTICVKKWTRL